VTRPVRTQTEVLQPQLDALANTATLGVCRAHAINVTIPNASDTAVSVSESVRIGGTCVVDGGAVVLRAPGIYLVWARLDSPVAAALGIQYAPYNGSYAVFVRGPSAQGGGTRHMASVASSELFRVAPTLLRPVVYQSSGAAQTVTVAIGAVCLGMVPRG